MQAYLPAFHPRYGIHLWGMVLQREPLQELGSTMLTLCALTIREFFLMTDDNPHHPEDFVTNHVTGVFPGWNLKEAPKPLGALLLQQLVLPNKQANTQINKHVREFQACLISIPGYLLDSLVLYFYIDVEVPSGNHGNGNPPFLDDVPINTSIEFGDVPAMTRGSAPSGGIFFQNKVDYATWFGWRYDFIHGIQMLPVSPALLMIRTPEFCRQELGARGAGGAWGWVMGLVSWEKPWHRSKKKVYP